MAEPGYIIGEGAGDAAFFEALLKTHNIQGYGVHKRPKADEGGNGYFERTLDALMINQVADERLLFVIVGDNDDTPDDSFKAIRRQIKAIASLGLPDKAEAIVKPRVPGKAILVPDVVVLMLPLDKHCGALETLCFEAAKSKWPAQATCAERFAECIGNQIWGTSKKHKLLLSCLLGGICEKNPTVTLSSAFWTDVNGEPLIPLDHQCFAPIVNKLVEWGRHFPAPSGA